ncbi:MAG: YbbR-like domain-containing protein [Bacillus sp. (in: Bacteria)]|nr:YbbR-like domain-containing protein [Bacillus sp. (in: firmicutes)]
MDKLFYNTWFIKGISVLIAILLFLMVNADNVNNQPGGIPGITNGLRVMEEVDVTVYYDDDRHVLTQAPEPVQVTLRGPQSVLTYLQLANPRFEFYVDLRGKEAGVYYERVHHRGFSPDLSVSVVPSTVRVTIQEKQTVSFPVEVELINQGEIEDGYSLGTPTVTPSNVDITAAQGIVEQIASVRATVDVSGRNATFQEATGLVVLDQYGNEINVTTNPPVVDVTVPITSPYKEVPIRIDREGELRAGLAIENITAQPSHITIYGPASVINNISFIDGIAINLSQINGDTALTYSVPVPEGVERVEPETVTINIDVTEEEQRDFADFAIGIVGRSEDKVYEFIDPEEGTIDIAILGSATHLSRIERNDLQLYIDVEGLPDGEHTVPLQFNGPQNVRATLERSNVRILISDDSPTEGETGDNGESPATEDEEEDSEAETT